MELPTCEDLIDQLFRWPKVGGNYHIAIGSVKDIREWKLMSLTTCPDGFRANRCGILFGANHVG